MEWADQKVSERVHYHVHTYVPISSCLTTDAVHMCGIAGKPEIGLCIRQDHFAVVQSLSDCSSREIPV